MDRPAKSLRLFVRAATALGFLSLMLSGELSLPWMLLCGAAWMGHFAVRFPSAWTTQMKQSETVAVAGMVAMLFFDFLLFRNTIFIAVTHFLILFQVFKLMGEQTRKDAFQMFFFSFFQILASCTLSVDPWHAAILLAMIPTATAALFWNLVVKELEDAGSTTPLEDSIYRRFTSMASWMCVGALPLILVLTGTVFVLFPRLTINAPLPGFNGQSMGYTDQVNLSQTGSLEQSSSVVLWLSFAKTEDQGRWNGYLRGDTLSQFTGKQWGPRRDWTPRQFSPDSNGIFVLNYQRPIGEPLRQTITLTDTSANTLFAMGRPIRVMAPLPVLQEFEGGSLHWPTPLRRPLRYDVVSEEQPIDPVQPLHLELPSIPMERIRQLAQEKAGTGTPMDQARQLEQFLQINYRYSVDYGDTLSDNPVETFLFDRKAGSCGHFASALALMLRLQHIPSRLVAGYLKGEWNEPAEAYVFRARDAHAWVEAYIDGSGWVAFDPSPRQGFGDTFFGARVYSRWRQYGDYFGYKWNRLVIQYDLYAQIRAFEAVRHKSGQMGFSLMSWWEAHRRPRGSAVTPDSDTAEDTSPAGHVPWAVAITLLLVAFVCWKLWRRQARPEEDPRIAFYLRFLERMKQEGLPKETWETGLDYLQRLSARKPTERDKARTVTDHYYQARFRKGSR